MAKPKCVDFIFAEVLSLSAGLSERSYYYEMKLLVRATRFELVNYRVKTCCVSASLRPIISEGIFVPLCILLYYFLLHLSILFRYIFII